MDKKTFISKLEQSLSVLQEDELKDIISEYEQHIDMKQERGLTEEEAIADFGSLDELTGEILEAYHVRADYDIVQKRGQKNICKNIIFLQHRCFRKIFRNQNSLSARCTRIIVILFL